MKSLMLLWQLVLEESGTVCGTSTTLDLKTAQSRFEHEGLSFFTITLPGFCSDLQKGLDRGFVAHDLFAGFRFTGGFPSFLRGFLESVFDQSSGVLLDNPSIDSIQAMRQVCLLFSKIALPCSDARVTKAIEGYVKCEQELKEAEYEWSPVDYADFSRIGRLLFAELFTQMDRDVYEGNVTPKFGPGATAERVSNNARFKLPVWTERLEDVFPALEFCKPNARYWQSLSGVQFLEPGAELPVRVITVPKTLKAPRIIAIEPSYMMYVQQAILQCFMEHWGRDNLLSQFLGFDDQVPNQHMARLGSLNGSLATLDLSEASDRVSNQLVRSLLANHPNLLRGVDACRSRRADVPGHGVIRLSKFASMGSALCFPMEACVFLTCIFVGIEKELNTRLTRRLLKQFVGSVRVFGDDIIVPKEYVSSVIGSLEHFGAKVNRDKSFWNGKFRESCGKEYFDGNDVSIVKVRQMLPTSWQHAEGVLATSSTRNQFYQLGLWRTCAWLDEYLLRILRGRYPVVLPTSPVIGRHSYLGYTTERMCDLLHRPLVKGYVVGARSPIDKLDGEAALLKFFLKRGFKPFEEGHLERAGRPEAVNIKLRWASAT